LVPILLSVIVISILCTTALIISIYLWIVIKHFLGRK
jgi:hypothetical protein